VCDEHFTFLQGSVETLFRCGGKCVHAFTANSVQKLYTKFYQKFYRRYYEKHFGLVFPRHGVV